MTTKALDSIQYFRKQRLSSDEQTQRDANKHLKQLTLVAELGWARFNVPLDTF